MDSISLLRVYLSAAVTKRKKGICSFEEQWNELKFTESYRHFVKSNNNKKILIVIF